MRDLSNNRTSYNGIWRHGSKIRAVCGPDSSPELRKEVFDRLDNDDMKKQLTEIKKHFGPLHTLKLEWTSKD